MAHKIEAVVTMKKIYQYQAPAYGYGTEWRYIYNMVAEDGTVYVWKTAAFMGYYKDAENGNFINKKGVAQDFLKINEGDTIRITANVVGNGEYKGQPQVIVQRVKVLECMNKAKTYEEIMEERAAEKERKKQEQAESIGKSDFVWEMPYRQYKSHYSDCETVIGSYNDHGGMSPASIKVIIRDGRLKNSGVRGQHFSGYEFFFTADGKKARVCYRAVSEDNAVKRLYKEFPNAQDVTPGKIYMYGC